MKRTAAVVPILVAAASLAVVAAPPLQAAPADEQLAAASALFDAKRFEEAGRALDAFLLANPKHPKAPAAALALGRARMERKEYAKAAEAFAKAAGSKDAGVVPLARLALGEAALYAGQYAKAAAALAAAAANTNLKPEQAALVRYWLGQANFEQGKFAEAEAAYLAVTQKYPESDVVDGAWFGAGLAALRQNKSDAARERLRAVVDRFPQSADRPQARFLLARIDLDAKRYAEARAGFEAFLNGSGAKAEPSLRAAAEEGLVRALLETKDYAGAASRLDAMLARLPAGDARRPRVLLSLGHSRYRQSQHEAALVAYRDAAKSKEANVAAEGLYWAANAALALKRNADASALFGQLASRFPKHPLAAKASSAVADAATDPVQLQAALKNAPPGERARGTLRLARLLLEQRKYAPATAALKPLVAAKPEAAALAEAQYLLGLAYEGQNNNAPAVLAYAEAVRLAPRGAAWENDAQTRLAWLYLDAKQPAKAEKAADAALASATNNDAENGRQARLARMQALLDQSKWDAALAAADKLLADNPPDETRAAVLFTRAWATEKRGRPGDALSLWEQLAREHPASPYAADALMRAGDAAALAEQHGVAAEKYAALLAAFAKSPLASEARFKRGTALYNEKRYDEAAREWDAVAAAGKAAGEYAPESLYWSGVACDRAGRKPDAITRLGRLVASYPTHARVANAKVRLAALKAVAGTGG